MWVDKGRKFHNGSIKSWSKKIWINNFNIKKLFSVNGMIKAGSNEDVCFFLLNMINYKINIINIDKYLIKIQTKK